jgi:hypothetical protein
MDEPLNIEGDAEDVLRTLLDIEPSTENKDSETE